ncbi:hypothetical protein, partial [Roseibium sp. RKSG952]|uniref:hypothetical protein n=1 Tax=Roseibium sp. RKSG952 TaxID=2529384 RepID=UPI0013CCFDC3
MIGNAFRRGQPVNPNGENGAGAGNPMMAGLETLLAAGPDMINEFLNARGGPGGGNGGPGGGNGGPGGGNGGPGGGNGGPG